MHFVFKSSARSATKAAISKKQEQPKPRKSGAVLLKR